MKKAQIWVHPNIRYMGGDFDEDTGRTYFGGEWKQRVARSLEDFDGDSIAITTYKRGEQNYDRQKHEWTDEEWDDRVDRPYGSDNWDEIIEDPNYGAIEEDGGQQRTDLTREKAEQWAKEYDQIVVRGGYFGDCEERFVEQLAEISPDTEIIVDPENSFVNNRSGLMKIQEKEKMTDRDREQQRAEDKPTATAYYNHKESDHFAPAREYENVTVRTVEQEDHAPTPTASDDD